MQPTRCGLCPYFSEVKKCDLCTCFSGLKNNILVKLETNYETKEQFKAIKSETVRQEKNLLSKLLDECCNTEPNFSILPI